MFSQQNYLEETKLLNFNLNNLNDNSINRFSAKKIIAPSFLMLLSLTLNKYAIKSKLQTEFRNQFKDFETGIDKFTPFFPIVELYSFDLLNLKSKNSVWNQTKYLFISNLFASAITLSFKHLFKIERPDKSSFDSYPSGQSTIAFVSSQVLWNEFYPTNKIIAFSGLLSSISTGSLRVINNRHWIPDVLMGAAIGIFATNLVYHFKPLRNWNPWRKKNTKLSSIKLSSFKNSNELKSSY